MRISRSMMKKLASVSVFGLGAALFHGETAHADVITGPMLVQATVDAACSVTATPVNFGNYDTIAGTAVNSLSGQIQVTCTLGVPWSVAVGNGANYSGGTRRMSNGTSTALTSRPSPSLTFITRAKCLAPSVRLRRL